MKLRAQLHFRGGTGCSRFGNLPYNTLVINTLVSSPLLWVSQPSLATRLLEKMGHTVFVVNNGEEALSILMAMTIEVVLMDIQMPVMDGTEATGKVRAQEGHGRQHLPIIAMTAHALQGDRERWLAAGMDGYISKPVKRETIEEAIALVRPNESRVTLAVTLEHHSPDPVPR